MKPSKELIEHWANILSRKGVNYQVYATVPPKEDEKFAVLWLVDLDTNEKTFASHGFVVTEALKQFLERKTAEFCYFSTNEKTGKKQGIHVEWVSRDKVWTATAPEIIERIESFAPTLNKFIKQNGRASIPEEVIENFRAVHEGCAVCGEMINLDNIKIHPKYAEAGVHTYQCKCGHRCFVGV